MPEEEIDKEIKRIDRKIYCMECAYDDLITNHKDEWDTLHSKLSKLWELKRCMS